MILFANRYIFCLIKLLIFSFLILFSNGQVVCQLNPNCFDGCSDSTCVYEPSINPFYNSSLSREGATYNGPYCCEGCNSGYFLWMDMKTCSETCSLVTGVQTFGNPLTRTCDFVCPNPFLGDPTSTRCVTKCPDDYWVNLNIIRCVFYCPDDLSFYYIPDRICMKSCQEGNYTYQGTDKRIYCAPSCPAQLFADIVEMACVRMCPMDLYADVVTRKCVLECPLGTFKHPDTKKCESICFGSYPYGDIASNFCSKTCPINDSNKTQTYGENISSLCVQACPSGSFGHKQVHICVQMCFGTYSITNNITNTCEAEFPIFQSLDFLNITLITILSSILGSILVLVVTSLLVYKFYFKKRIQRKPWKYDYMKDVQFYL